MPDLRSLASRIDDWVNPIAVKELRQAVRGRFVVSVLILSLLCQLVAVGVVLLTQTLTTTGFEQPALGSNAFQALFSVAFGICFLLIPLYSAVRMTAERSDTNIDLMFITTIRPRTIIFGKLWAALTLVVVLFSATFPFLAFCYVMRGVDLFSMLISLVVSFLFVGSAVVLGIFVGAIPSSRPFKILLGLVLFALMLAMYMPAVAGLGQFVRMGSEGLLGDVRLIKRLGGTLLFVLFLDAILLVCSISLITPPVANRALPIRIMLAVVWVLSLGGAVMLALETNEYTPLKIWSVAQIAVASLLFCSAVGERDQWGPRISRTIPLSEIKRALAFVFYSGGAGGALLATILAVATIVVWIWGAHWISLSLSSYASSPSDRMLFTRWLAQGFFCIAAYALTALWLRRMVLHRVPARATWAIGLVLFLILSIAPPSIAFLVAGADSGDHEQFWLTSLANPFPVRDANDNPLVRGSFLAVWIGIVLAGNGPWFIAQVRRFRPNRSANDPPPAVLPIPISNE